MEKVHGKAHVSKLTRDLTKDSTVGRYLFYLRRPIFLWRFEALTLPSLKSSRLESSFSVQSDCWPLGKKSEYLSGDDMVVHLATVHTAFQPLCGVSFCNQFSTKRGPVNSQERTLRRPSPRQSHAHAVL